MAGASEAVSRIHHTGVVVRSLEEAYAFYRDTLGLPFLKEALIEDQGVKATLLDLGNSLLELLEPIEPDTGIARFLERRGEGLHHVCLEVEDIRAALADLKAKGVPLVDEEPRQGLVGTVAFLHPSALHGVLAELVEGSTAVAPGGSGGMKVRRMDHLVIAVQDLEQAASAWAETFGLGAEPPYRPEGSHLELACLPVGDPDGHDAFLELARPTTREHRVARHIAEWGEGMFSLSIEVDDLAGAVQALRAKDVIVSEPEAGVWPNSRLARIRRSSAFGVAIQLIERGAS